MLLRVCVYLWRVRVSMCACARVYPSDRAEGSRAIGFRSHVQVRACLSPCMHVRSRGRCGGPTNARRRGVRVTRARARACVLACAAACPMCVPARVRGA
jgi:hypothetical protein